MIEYNLKRRLHYIPGGAIRAEMGMWPAGANWWEPTTGSFTCVAAYQAKGAASLAASYSNLANPGTYDLTLGTAPAWNSTDGWQFNGATNNRYLRTGVTWGASTWSAIIRYTSAVSQWPFGADAGAASNRVGILAYNLGTDTRWANSNEVSKAYAPTGGTLGFADRKRYADGVYQTSGDIAAAGTLPAVEIYIGGLNRANSMIAAFTGNIQAIAFYSTTLDATQMGEVHTAMAAL